MPSTDKIAVVETVDLTPTWTEILPVWIMMYEQAMCGDCTDPDLVITNCKKELARMALAADRWNAYMRELNDEASVVEQEHINEGLAQ